MPAAMLGDAHSQPQSHPSELRSEGTHARDADFGRLAASPSMGGFQPDAGRATAQRSPLAGIACSGHERCLLTLDGDYVLDNGEGHVSRAGGTGWRYRGRSRDD
jgi:hypothetical protein